MADVELYNDLTPVSNEWLRRYQVPTDRTIDRTSLELIKIFVNTLDPNMERLPGLGAEPLDEANKFLTVEIEELGVVLGRNRTRDIGRARNILKFIKENPYVTYSTNENGKKIYHEMPLIKHYYVSEAGKCNLVFNDELRHFFFPAKNFALCSFALLKEIRQRNVYAAIIFEEACSYEGMFKFKQFPSFIWGMKTAREKFSFDRIKDISEDYKSYVTFEIRTMCPDHMMNEVIKPAIAVLEEFFDEGKIRFWLKLEVQADLEKASAGRPPNNLFRFILRKDKKVVIEDVKSSPEQQDLFGYEEMNTLYYIRKELNDILSSKQLIKTIIEQLQRNEQIGSHKDVLATIKKKRSNYDSRPQNDRANLILSILGKEHHLGDPAKYGEPDKKEERFWPDSLEERIKVMMDSPEIKDRAAQDFSLSSDEVNNLLSNDFLQICQKNNKLKKDWADAVDYFFNWLRRLGIRGPLNNVRYRNNKSKSSYGRTKTSSYGQTAAIILAEYAD